MIFIWIQCTYSPLSPLPPKKKNKIKQLNTLIFIIIVENVFCITLSVFQQISILMYYVVYIKSYSRTYKRIASIMLVAYLKIKSLIFNIHSFIINLMLSFCRFYLINCIPVLYWSYHWHIPRTFCHFIIKCFIQCVKFFFCSE